MIEMHSMKSQQAPLLGNQQSSIASRSTTYAAIALLGVIGLVGMAFTREDMHKLFPTQQKFKQASMCSNLQKAGYGAKAQADCIAHLPGLTFHPSFRSFSGYLPVSSDGKRELFYWFVEAEKNGKTSPENAPLVFWTNGGPGCSGLGGLLSEHGPYGVRDDMSLHPNPVSINKLANVVYFEGPVGVGFSAPAAGHDIVVGDISAARDNAAMIRAFLKKFPKYRNHEVTILSESYGGHYMPTLALELLDGNDKKLKPHVNFKAMAVGNPYVNWWSNRRGSMNAYFGHGLTKLPLVQDWNSQCDKPYTEVNMGVCNALYNEVNKKLGHLDPYALDFTYCPTDKLENGGKARMVSDHKRIQKLMIHEAMQKILKVEKKTNYVACANTYIEQYLNKPKVQQALHAKKVKWGMCSTPIFKQWPQQSWEYPMEKAYKKLAESGKIKMMVYSGDDDSVCATYGTQLWMYELGFRVDTRADWKAWYLEDQLGGYHTRFVSQDGLRTAFDFVTIHTAGHMVPQTQPKRAFQIYKKFFDSTPQETMQFGDGFW